ncbi:hypothetical protein JYT19_00270 [Sulfobacillus acidophilus]|uniref:Uncharacterized protein n=1 Tax=Sulfobacillus acidophilus TaxID=53633 RepID=A0ABS3AVD5_9FIRM|nr:hypothetical protein [Sulfobacillus acidophilus]
MNFKIFLYLIIISCFASAQNDPVIKIIPDTLYFDQYSPVFIGNVTQNNSTLAVSSLLIKEPGSSDPMPIYKGEYTLTKQGTYEILAVLSNNELIKRVVVVDDLSPNLAIDAPYYRQMLNEQSPYNVYGKITDAISGPSQVQINGEEVFLSSNGTFVAPVSLSHGLNVFNAKGTDNAGLWAYASSNFYNSDSWLGFDPENEEPEQLKQSIVFHLNKLLFNNLNAGVNKEFSLGEIFKNGLSYTGIEGNEPSKVWQLDGKLDDESFGYRLGVYLKSVKLDKANVSLDLFDGGIKFKGNFEPDKEEYAVTSDFLLEVYQYAWGVPLPFADFVIKINFDSLSYAFDALLNKESGQDLKLEVKNLKFDYEGANVSLLSTKSKTKLPYRWMYYFTPHAWEEWLLTITSKIINIIKTTLYKSYKDTVAKELEKKSTDILMDFLKVFTQEIEIETKFIPWAEFTPTLKLFSQMDTLQATSEEIKVKVNTRALSSETHGHEKTDILLQQNCPHEFNDDKNDYAKEMAMQISINFINQILHSGWWGGVFDKVFNQFNLGDLVPKDYGISELDIKTTFEMPPIANDCNNDSHLFVQSGAILLDVSLKLFDRPIKFKAYAPMSAKLALTSSDNKLSIWIKNLNIDSFDVIEIVEGQKQDEVMLETLFYDFLLPKFLSNFQDLEIVNMALPPIEPHKISPLAPQNGLLEINDLLIEHQAGAMYLDANLLVVD